MALELFNTVMTVYSSKLRADVLHFAAEALVKQLVHRCGNNNARISECSLQVEAHPVVVSGLLALLFLEGRAICADTELLSCVAGRKANDASHRCMCGRSSMLLKVCMFGCCASAWSSDIGAVCTDKEGWVSCTGFC